MTILYPDFSHYDWDRNKGNPNWSTIASLGIVIIRASYGDPEGFFVPTRYFTEMATAAESAGMFTGGYHNLVHGDTASIRRQALHFKAQLDSVNADWAMLDVEPYEALKENGLYPRITDAVAFAKVWAEIDHRPLAIYLARWVWSSWLGTSQPDLRELMSHAKGPLINAHYVPGSGTHTELYTKAGGDSGPGWDSYGNVAPEVWQFTSSATIPGKNGVTDINAFKGSLTDFKGRMASKMAWYLVPALVEFRNQLNKIAPNRDKASDGSIGDYAHSQGSSSHNPDDTSHDNAEWDNDPDTRQDVRAIDVDIDFKVPGLTAQKLVDHLVKYAKNGTFWWLRYIIYNGKIYSKSRGWAGSGYNGSNKHTHHVHINNDFTEKADDVTNVNYRLNELLPEEEDMPLTSAEKKEIAALAAAEVWKAQPWGADYSAAVAIQRAYTNTNALNAAVDAIALKVDIDPAELEAIKEAVVGPTANAVVAALGTVDVETLAETLRNVLGQEKAARLAQAL